MNFMLLPLNLSSNDLCFFPLQRGFLLPKFNKSLKKSDFESSDQKSCLDFFSRNDTYSFPENQIFQKRHEINPNTAKWIFFPEMTLPDVPKRVWIFFPKMTLAHFPDFQE